MEWLYRYGVNVERVLLQRALNMEVPHNVPHHEQDEQIEARIKDLQMNGTPPRDGEKVIIHRNPATRDGRYALKDDTVCDQGLDKHGHASTDTPDSTRRMQIFYFGRYDHWQAKRAGLIQAHLRAMLEVFKGGDPVPAESEARYEIALRNVERSFDAAEDAIKELW